MTATIPVYGRTGVVAHALVDESDVDLANSYRWNLSPKGHATTSARIDGRSRALPLHRLLLGLRPGDGLEGDHINRVKLDNRRENLRVVTSGQNGQNKPSCRNSSSRFRGVTWHKRDRRWLAYAEIDGKYRHLGSFTDELEAARAAARYRAEHMPFAVEDPALLEAAA